jgi:hypothetical protein
VNGPDLGRAKRIAGRVHATAIMYTPNLSPWREEAQIVRRNLKPLGIDVEVKEFPTSNFFTRITRRGEPFDLAVSGYRFDPDPVGILAYLLSGDDISHLSDPVFSRQLEAVEKLSGAKRYRAASRLALAVQRDGVASRVREDGEPRLLLGAHRVPGVPARLRHGPRCPLPAEVTRLRPWSGPYCVLRTIASRSL